MKKAAIITLYGNFNFGNKLQNFALQTVLENMGFNVETLIFSPVQKEIVSTSLRNKVKLKIKKINCRTLKRKVENLIFRSDYKKKDRLRESKFKDFSDKYIHTRYISNSYDLATLSKEYDYFVIGSDQIWNPEYINSFTWNFAAFADETQRIVYAASLGTDEIPKTCFSEFKHSLQGIKHISVREKQAKKTLWEQFHVDSIVVLDPTLLICREKWKKIIECLRIEMPLVLTYFLGGYTKYPQNELRDLCKNRKWKNINLNYIYNNQNYINGPIEFLRYIKGATLVLTDSFHGAVFSIIFHTPFVIFKRDNQENGMYRRLEHLLSVFHLEQRQYKTGIPLETYLECDFTESDQILETMRAKSLNYLEDAIKSE